MPNNDAKAYGRCQYSYSESRKEAARLSTCASCPNCAMLTGFDEAPSSIMVLVEAPMNSEEMGINGAI